MRATPPERPALSERGSMIVALPAGLVHGERPFAATLALGALALTRKAELHYTAINFALGKHVAKVCAAHGEARQAIDAVIAAHDWSFALREELVHLCKPGGPADLHTIVVRIDADLAGFYAAVATALRGRLDPAEPHAAALLAGLATPPPPHITIYTSDPAGERGIGLNTAAELDAALDRGRAGDRSALCAFPLHPAVVRATDLG
jgi:hypothetical protein